jgi:hydroxycarboxylate dehydrogenase B
VKSSRRIEGVDAILMPGEPEARTESARSRDGIAIDEDTWYKIETIAKQCGVL